MATDINPSDFTAEFTTRKHYEYPNRLQFVDGVLTHPTLGEIATMECLRIQRRNQSKDFGDFLRIMDATSQELHDFSVTLFDKHSYLRPWLKDGGLRSGSGCWGEELSYGDMLYIQELRVRDQFRRRGLGSLFLQKLLASPHVEQYGHVLCWPEFTDDDTSDLAFRARIGAKPSAAYVEQKRKQRANIVSFYRKNGFRRIGLTKFFAYSPKHDHPSRKIDASDDPDPTVADASLEVLEEEELITKFPIHHAISNNRTPSVAHLIRMAYRNDHASVRKHDMHGLTPIHIAASKENLHATRALLEADPSGIAKDLKDNENMELMTPLELLESSMRSTKEFSETVLGKWDGYPDDSLRCEYLIKKGINLPLLAGVTAEDEYVKKRKFGCTCGRCTDGWLSPRMRFRLSAEASMQADMMRSTIPDLPSRQPLDHDALYFFSVFDYIPPTVKKEIYKTFFIGACTVFDAISFLLDASGDSTLSASTVFPAAAALDAISAMHFMKKGGKIEHVFDTLINVSKEQSGLGDGTWDEAFDVEYRPEEIKADKSADKYSALPKCSNDLEFDLVRQQLGLANNLPWGPYYEDNEGEEIEVDEESGEE